MCVLRASQGARFCVGCGAASPTKAKEEQEQKQEQEAQLSLSEALEQTQVQSARCILSLSSPHPFLSVLVSSLPSSLFLPDPPFTSSLTWRTPPLRPCDGCPSRSFARQRTARVTRSCSRPVRMHGPWGSLCSINYYL